MTRGRKAHVTPYNTKKIIRMAKAIDKEAWSGNTKEHLERQRITLQAARSIANEIVSIKKDVKSKPKILS